jgi:anti-sigma B factor antagonist
MVLSEEAVGDIIVVVIDGRLDTHTADRFCARLAELLRSGPPCVMIEASRLSYVSSAGFRALLITAKLAAEMGSRLAVCGLTAPIRRVVELGGFHEVIETFASREEAMAKLSAG